ncbi:hypothetical protein [Pseudogemmobacter humi]|uniref:Uncharacterized protein n=1 Tax=Pseudogemmobacter humi TaxID=2483812 RepID=A0A3P5WY07_9RHOB|nr:hypothetical protein [Pseudogemmobacter humi]VDC26392.1 hypothetical protein XINFAN_01631 [Pseudogemmobacter humi]
MTRPDFDKEAENTKFDVQQEAQKQKMGHAGQPGNPHTAQRTNEPNAGGENREVGNRKGRMDDRG